MRRIMTAAVLSAVLSAVIPLIAAAQQNPPPRNAAPAPGQHQSPPPAMDTAKQAPVGHHQPNRQSVPPAVQREESSGQRVDDPLGPLPQLCRDC